MDDSTKLSPEEKAHIRDEIARISSQIDAATHRLLTLIRKWDASEEWAREGALTCANWLTWRIGIGVVTARDYVRVARALAGLPKIDEALRLGKISYSKVRALTRCASPENEDMLLDLALHGTGAQLEKIVGKYKRVLRVGEYIPVDDPEFRFVRQAPTGSGMVRITAQLLPEEAEIVRKALDAAQTQAAKSRDDASAEASKPTPLHEQDLGTRLENERQANADRVDGLLWLSEALLAGRVTEVGAAPVEILMHVGAATGQEPSAPPVVEAELANGRVLERETTERLTCDAALVEIERDADGTPLDIGRRTRTISPALRRALVSRDAGCRFPGCDRTRTDGHHIVPWSKGGATSLGNLVSLCRRHHRLVHEGGWRIELREGNEILFYDSLDRLSEPSRLRSAVSDATIEQMVLDLADHGIRIDADTAPTAGDLSFSWDMAIEGLVTRFVRAQKSRDASAESSESLRPPAASHS